MGILFELTPNTVFKIKLEFFKILTKNAFCRIYLRFIDET